MEVQGKHGGRAVRCRWLCGCVSRLQPQSPCMRAPEARHNSWRACLARGPCVPQVYHGQFDSSRPRSDTPVTGGDLRAALEALLAGQPVPKARPSIGWWAARRGGAWGCQQQTAYAWCAVPPCRRARCADAQGTCRCPFCWRCSPQQPQVASWSGARLVRDTAGQEMRSLGSWVQLLVLA